MSMDHYRDRKQDHSGQVLKADQREAGVRGKWELTNGIVRIPVEKISASMQPSR